MLKEAQVHLQDTAVIYLVLDFIYQKDDRRN